MQRMVGLGQIERTVAFVGNLAGRFPEAADRLDVDAIVDDYADRAGAPPKIIRSVADAGTLRQGREQDAQMAKMAAMAGPAKDGAAAMQMLGRLGAQGGGPAGPGPVTGQ
jgi:hypothetical protein